MAYSNEAPTPNRIPLLCYNAPYPVSQKHTVDVVYRDPVNRDNIISIVRKSYVVLRNFSGWRIQTLGRWGTIARYVGDFADAIHFHNLEADRVDRLYDEEYGEGVTGS